MSLPFRPLVLFLLLVSWAFPASARQLSFFRDGPQLVYHWQLPDGNMRPLRLLLPEPTAVPTLIAWRPAQADAYIYRALLADARIQYPEARFRLHRLPQQLQLEFETSHPEQQTEIRAWLATQQQARLDEYLEQHYFVRRRDAFDQERIQLDYGRLVQELSPEMADLARLILDLPQDAPLPLDPTAIRQQLALLLNFVQSIPYQTQPDRGTQQRGLGFLLPRELLARNQGDCDSKVVLLATLLHGLYPQLPLALLLVPGHALLGVGLAAAPDEESLILPQGPVLLVEPTGPALLPPGKIGDESRLYLRSGSYTFESVQVTEVSSSPTL